MMDPRTRYLRVALERAVTDLDSIANAADPFDDAVGTQDHGLLLDIERLAAEASNRANHALNTARPSTTPAGATAGAFYDLANQLRSCIDPATPEREAADFRRIADRAAALGDAHRVPSTVVTLADCPVGLFISSHGSLCVKTEYGSNEGRIDAYIVESGEMFWGGAPQTIASQRASPVTPVALDLTMDAVRSTGTQPVHTLPDAVLQDMALRDYEAGIPYGDAAIELYTRSQIGSRSQDPSPTNPTPSPADLVPALTTLRTALSRHNNQPFTEHRKNLVLQEFTARLPPEPRGPTFAEALHAGVHALVWQHINSAPGNEIIGVDFIDAILTIATRSPAS